MSEKVTKKMQSIVGLERVVTEENVLKRESVDYVGYRNWERFEGHYNVPVPICVVKPQNVAQLSCIMKYLNENKVNVIPKTGGSCATAGLEVINNNTVVVDGGDMNQILEISEESMYATVQCGVALEYLEELLNSKGYSTGHFPQSLPMAQMGGLTATRSIGQFSTLYGGIEDLVVGLEAVMPNGEIIRIKNVPRRSAGPDHRHVFIGNEGTLAYITEVTVKIFPYKPEARWKMAYGVKDMSTGLAIIREILTTGYKPAVVRLHDDYEAETDYEAFVEAGECLLLFIADGPADLNEVTGRAINRICEKHNARTIGDKPLQIWLEHRNDLCNEMDDSPKLRSKCVSDTCEIAAVWTDVGGIYERAMKRVKQEVESLIYFCGHSSHSYTTGTNIYFKFGYQAQQEDEKTKEVYMQILGIIIDETLKVGGSMAHHHGVGKYRTQWTKREHGSSYSILKGLKDVFDPNGIMNAGAVFPVE